MSRAAAAAFLGAALALCAAAFGSPSLYVPGIALLLLGVAAAVWVLLAARGLAAERTLGPASVEEEQPYPIRIDLRAGALPPPGGELEEPLLGRPVELRGLRSQRVRVEIRFARRGRRAIGPSVVRVRDPLNLATSARTVGEPGEVLVLPRIEPVRAAAGGGPLAGSEHELSAQLLTAAAELELDSLRPYRQGAPASRIHWPTAARTGELMERRLVADADAWPLVILDARRPTDEEALDNAVRAAASLTHRLARAGGCALLLPGDRRPAAIAPDLGAWHTLHARLALAEADDRAPALAPRSRAGAVFWVKANRSRARALVAGTGAARYLVAPGPVEGLPAVFTVAGCVGHRLDRVRTRVAA